MGQHPMARPREFDEDEVLDRALETFWARGYEGTSIQDLVDATGVGRASLYGAFGDKEGLYRRVLERYVARAAPDDVAHAKDATPSERLRATLRRQVRANCSKKGPRGCFLQSAGTAGDEAPFARELLSASLAHLERELTALIEAGQATGELVADRPAKALSRMLVALMQGVSAAARAGWGPDRLEAVVDEAMALVAAR